MESVVLRAFTFGGLFFWISLMAFILLRAVDWIESGGGTGGMYLLVGVLVFCIACCAVLIYKEFFSHLAFSITCGSNALGILQITCDTVLIVIQFAVLGLFISKQKKTHISKHSKEVRR